VSLPPAAPAVVTTCRAVAFLALLSCWPATAAADWLITPFFGVTFGADTSFVDLEEATDRRKSTFGVAGAVLGEGIVGVEVEFARTPRFFERGSGAFVSDSNVTTLMGSLVVTTPLSVTRESLRPYVVGGLGLMHAASDDLADIFTFESDVLGMSVGGGALGFFGDTVGVRLDLRYFRNVTEGSGAGIEFGPTRLRYWRGSVGLTLRY
jgi:hypothetical protein